MSITPSRLSRAMATQPRKKGWQPQSGSESLWRVVQLHLPTELPSDRTTPVNWSLWYQNTNTGSTGDTRAKCGGPRSPLSAVGPIACCRSGHRMGPGVELIFANQHPGGVPYGGPYRVRTKEFLPRTSPCEEQCSTSKRGPVHGDVHAYPQRST